MTFQKLLLFSEWTVEQKVFLFDNLKDIRDEIARPSHDVPWRVISQTVGKIQVRNFKRTHRLALKLSDQILSKITQSGYEFIMFLVKIVFRFFLYTFLLLTQDTLSVSKI